MGNLAGAVPSVGRRACRVVLACLVLAVGTAADAPPGVSARRLAHSTSPYLQQHADNPVDWYEWGDEAFRAARDQGKPIFLSVGYSTCHWCHVMGRESFSDPAIAAVLNQHFIAIKLDREQRPDVDAVYMRFIQATTGRGGWPMSVWLTPDLEPIVGGTYFPPQQFQGALQQIADLWQTRRADITAQAKQVIEALRAQAAREPAGTTAVTDATGHLISGFTATFDAEEGGFGGAPKFPRPAALDALLAAHRQRADSPEGQRALTMVLATLRAMARGGIHDHLGGGFHRYSVDAQWRVPHFEKMLYDQGQLAATYAEAYRLSGDADLARILRDICDYVLRDLQEPAGGFHAAEDADSLLRHGDPAHAEGAWYVWTEAQLADVLDAAEHAVIRHRFGTSDSGNIAADLDPHEELRERNVLAQAEDLAATAAALGRTPDEVAGLLTRAVAKLVIARDQRPRPHRDDKIITAWNGLMITGLCRAAGVLDEPRYASAARAAAVFLHEQLYDPTTRTLYRTWRGGQRDPTPGMAADYVFLARGLLDLAAVTGETRWLVWARALLQRLDDDFRDPAGGWFETDGHDASVLVRLRDDYDGAEPAATGVALASGWRLAEILQDEAWQERLKTDARILGNRALTTPTAMPGLLTATLAVAAPPRRIVITGTRASSQPLLRAALRGSPDDIVLVLDAEARRMLAPTQPFLAAMPTPETTPTAFVCTGTACLPAIVEPQRLSEVLEQQKP